MADADEMIREAEYAFRNIAPGSTHKSKYTARAKRIATRLVRKYPQSLEAEQARQILERLRSPGELVPAAASPRPGAMSPQPVAPSPHAPHPMKQHQRDHLRRPAAAAKSTEPDSWADIWQKITSLAAPQKKVLGIVLFFGFILVTAMPFLLLVFAYYAVKPEQVREHINSLLDTLV